VRQREREHCHILHSELGNEWDVLFVNWLKMQNGKSPI